MQPSKEKVVMSIQAALGGRIAEWVAIATVAVGGGVYVGNVENTGTANAAAIAELKPVATAVAVDIATLQERTMHMQGTLNEIRAQQHKILDELRK
jgi:hypothetical protein